jgi:NADH-quinone oxidoreductase subunit C/D
VVDAVNGMPVGVWERLEAHFPGALSRAESAPSTGSETYPQGAKHRMTGAVSRAARVNRPWNEGVLVHAQHLLPVLRFLRDELGYGYLSNLTAVDHPETLDGIPPHIDVVYHVYRLDGGEYLALHVHTPREASILPSISPDFPAAHLQEREVWDMFGVHFEGHPDLRRLLLWEGFDGFPLRKDWREAYYEQEHKPFRNRFPGGGNPTYAEGRASALLDTGLAAHDLPKGYVLCAEAFNEAAQRLYVRMVTAGRDWQEKLEIEETILDIGSSQPDPHGVFRMAVRLEGETVRHLEPVLGYVHRSHEKIGERNTWLQNIPYADRLDYINGMTSTLAYCLAMERLLEWEVPERAEYIRVILSEFSRVMNHVRAAELLSHALGLVIPASLRGLDERAAVLDLFEAAAGRRMMFNYMRPGGVARDLPAGWVEQARGLVRPRLARKLPQLRGFLLDCENLKARSKGLGVLTGVEAVAYGVSGPVLRASGVPYDVRRADPYGIYDRFAFDVATREGGDVYARMALRFDEITQSLRILEQALEQIPDSTGEPGIQSYRLSPKMHLPPGETYGRIEAPKGELGFYLVSHGGANPYRYHIRSTSLLNLTPLPHLSRGVQIADVGLILASLDLTMAEVDR